jgi:hypothetical protein
MLPTYLGESKYDWKNAIEQIVSHLEKSGSKPLPKNIIAEYKNAYRSGILPGPVFDKLDCEYGADYYTNQAYREYLNTISIERQEDLELINKTRIGWGILPHPPLYEQLAPIYNNTIENTIQSYVSNIISNAQPANTKPKLVILFDRFGAPSRHITNFCNQYKITDPKLLVGISNQYTSINNYDIIDYLYTGENPISDQRVILEHPDLGRGTTYGLYSKYADYMKNRYNSLTLRNYTLPNARRRVYTKANGEYRPYDYAIDNYSDLVQVSYYVRSLLLNGLFAKKANIVYHYTHRNAYNLTCLLDLNRDALQNYDIEIYFPALSESQYKSWYAYQAIYNGVLTKPPLINLYQTIVLNNIMYSLMLKQNISEFVNDSITNYKIYLLNETSSSELKPNMTLEQLNQACKQFNMKGLFELLKFYLIDIPSLKFDPDSISTDELHQSIQLAEKLYKDDIFNAIKEKKLSPAKYPTLILLYGPPGSGKSAIKKEIMKSLPNGSVDLELDYIVMNKNPLFTKLKQKKYSEIYSYKSSLEKIFGNTKNGIKMIEILLNTAFLNEVDRIFYYIFNSMQASYINIRNWVAENKFNILAFVTGRNINACFDILENEKVKGYKKEIHAVHVNIWDEYINIISRSLTEQRYHNRKKIVNFSQQSFKNLGILIDKYDVTLYDNTHPAEGIIIVFKKDKNGITCGNICPPFDRIVEQDFQKTINKACKPLCSNVGGYNDSSYGNKNIKFILVILTLLIIVLIYIINYVLFARNTSNHKETSTISGNSAISE